MTDERKKFVDKFETLLMNLVVLKGLKLNIDENKYNIINADGSQYLRIVLFGDYSGMISIEAMKIVVDKLTPSKRVFIESSLAHFTELLSPTEFNFVLIDDKLFISYEFRLSLKLKKVEEYILITKLWDLVEETRQINTLVNLDMHLQENIKLN
jgi:hypothetical protein